MIGCELGQNNRGTRNYPRVTNWSIYGDTVIPKQQL